MLELTLTAAGKGGFYRGTFSLRGGFVPQRAGLALSQEPRDSAGSGAREVEMCRDAQRSGLALKLVTATL